MLRRLGQFLTKKKNQPQLKKGLAYIQAVNLFKEKLEKDSGLSREDVKDLKFEFQKGELIVVASDNLIAQEINFNTSELQAYINKKLDSDLISKIRVRRC